MKLIKGTEAILHLLDGGVLYNSKNREKKYYLEKDGFFSEDTFRCGERSYITFNHIIERDWYIREEGEKFIKEISGKEALKLLAIGKTVYPAEQSESRYKVNDGVLEYSIGSDWEDSKLHLNDILTSRWWMEE